MGNTCQRWIKDVSIRGGKLLSKFERFASERRAQMNRASGAAAAAYL
jgi:hypothetical protein